MESTVPFQALLFVPESLAQRLPTLLWHLAPQSIGPQQMHSTINEHVIQHGSPDD